MQLAMQKCMEYRFIDKKVETRAKKTKESIYFCRDLV